MLSQDRRYAFHTEYPHGRHDRPHGADQFRFQLSGIFDLSVRIIYTVYDDTVCHKPCEVPENGQSHSVCGQNPEFCIRHDVRPRFADGDDHTLFQQWRGLQENDERHYRRRRIFHRYGDGGRHGGPIVKEQKGGGAQ